MFGGKEKKLDRNVYEVLMLMMLMGGLWLKIIYAQLSTKINDIPIMNPKNKFMFGMSLLTVIMVFTLMYAIGGRYRMVLIWVVAVLLSVLIFADTVYARYYYNPITMSIFHQLTMVDNIGGSAASLFKWKDICFILDFPIVGIFALVIHRTRIELGKQSSFKWRFALSGLVFFIALAAFNVNYSKAETVHYSYERKYIARDMGLLYYHGYDLTSYAKRLGRSKTVTEEEKALIERHNSSSDKESNDYTGVAEGYNLVVIQVEAMMEYLVGYEVNGQSLTPFFDELKGESLYLSNTYFQTANGNTVDAEFLMNTSILPTYSGAVYFEFPTNNYESLPKILEEKGYKSYSFHGFEPSFWNREVMHRTLGFEHFYGLPDFDASDKVGWAISDKAFFEQSLDKLVTASEGQPFYGMMITLSSHHPYDGFIEGPFTGTENRTELINRYYNSINYVDGAVASFFDLLKEKGLYDNTIVVIYGDHGGLFNEDAQSQAEADGVVYDAYNWTKYQQVPVLIHVPGAFEGGKEIDKVSGQIDILPTTANLMNIQLPYALGQDVLDENYEGLVVKRFGDVITDEYIYLSDAQTVFDYKSGEVLQYNDYADKIDKAHEYLKVTDLILERDYFSNY